jgi:hypothetical protein
MQLEGVGSVSMRYLRLQIGWQIDDSDCFERASERGFEGHTTFNVTRILLFDTDTTTYAEKFGDEGNLIT